MKHLLPLFAFFLLILTGSKCRPEPINPVENPTPIDTSEVKLYLNDKLVAYTPHFVSYRGTESITYFFDQFKGDFSNILGITGPVPLTTGEYGRYITFNQYHHIDYGNHVYEQLEAESARFTIEKFDSVNKKVEGSLQAKFKRKLTGKETPDSYLPDTLSFKGSFNTKYIEY